MAFQTPWQGLVSQQTLLNNLDPLNRYLSSGYNQAQQQAQQAAQQQIGATFAPQFQMTQQRLGGNPLLADSGYANRLNRQLRQGAYGELSNRFGQISAERVNQENQSRLQLLMQRLGQQDQLNAMKYQHDLNQPTFGQTIGGILGAGIGTFGGAYLGGLGKKLSGYSGT